MGEYAIRKSDGERVKIGTCESMYYLRFEDRFLVTAQSGNVDPVADAGDLKFRLPFPDEDHIGPGGNYEDHSRKLRLYRKNDEPDFYGHDRKPVFGYSDFSHADLADDPGTIQLRHDPSGLSVNTACYHGIKLPADGGGFKAHWNGKSWFLELSQLRPVRQDNGGLRVFPVVACRHCGKAWRFEWADVWEYIEPQMQERFAEYAAQSVIDHDTAKASAQF